MFEFIFQGTKSEFYFFIHVMENRVPDSGIQLSERIDDEFHLVMNNDNNNIFKTGMIVTACYAKFERLESTIFE